MSAIFNNTNLHILIIDDNPEIHNDFKKILTEDSSAKSHLDDFEKKMIDVNIK